MLVEKKKKPTGSYNIDPESKVDPALFKSMTPLRNTKDNHFSTQISSRADMRDFLGQNQNNTNKRAQNGWSRRPEKKKERKEKKTLHRGPDPRRKIKERSHFGSISAALLGFLSAL